LAQHRVRSVADLSPIGPIAAVTATYLGLAIWRPQHSSIGMSSRLRLCWRPRSDLRLDLGAEPRAGRMPAEPAQVVHVAARDLRHGQSLVTAEVEWSPRRVRCVRPPRSGRGRRRNNVGPAASHTELAVIDLTA